MTRRKVVLTPERARQAQRQLDAHRATHFAPPGWPVRDLMSFLAPGERQFVRDLAYSGARRRRFDDVIAQIARSEAA